MNLPDGNFYKNQDKIPDQLIWIFLGKIQILVWTKSHFKPFQNNKKPKY